MASIGSAALLLSTNATELNKGLDAANSKIQAWANATNNKVKNVFGGIGEMATTGFKGLISILNAPITLLKLPGQIISAIGSAMGTLGEKLGSMFSAIPFVGGAFAPLLGLPGRIVEVIGNALTSLGDFAGKAFIFAFGAASSFYAAASKTIKSLALEGRKALALGLPPDFYMGLTQRAETFGVEGEAVNAMLFKLSGHLNEIGGLSPEMGAALSRLNLQLSDLKGKRLDDQFYTIVDRINQIPDAGERAGVSLALFSRQAAILAPLLSQGSQKIKAFIAEQRAMGTVLSPEQMGIVFRVRETLPRITAAFEGMWNRIVIAAAPAIEYISKSLKEGLKTLEPMFQKVENAATAAFAIITFLAEKAGKALGDWAGGLFKDIPNFTNFGKDVKTSGDMIINVLEMVAKAAEGLWDKMMDGLAGFGTALADIGKKVADICRGIADSILAVLEAVAGLMKHAGSDWKVERAGLSVLDFLLGEGTPQGKAAGDAGFPFIKRVTAWTDKKRAEIDAENADSPYAKLGAALEEAAKKLRAGIAKIPEGPGGPAPPGPAPGPGNGGLFAELRKQWEAFQVMRNAAAPQIVTATSNAPLKPEGSIAAILGSKEAYSIEAAYRVRGLTSGRDRIAQEQLQEQKNGNKIMDDILKKVLEMNPNALM